MLKEKKEDTQRQMFDILTDLEYPIEVHSVDTPDDYILTVFRINGKKGQPNNSQKSITKKPILFQHGLLDSSDGWLCNEEALNFPLILANLGFDVWLSISRGNK